MLELLGGISVKKSLSVKIGIVIILFSSLLETLCRLFLPSEWRNICLYVWIVLWVISGLFILYAWIPEKNK